MGSPYQDVKQTIFRLGKGSFDYVNIRIDPRVSAHEAIAAIGAVCKTYAPAVPFSFKFVDDEYAKKFESEERVGQLARCFAVLAVFISCLGLFGMASFMAEQRVKEIGVRKVLGASVVRLWGLLSREFVVLGGVVVVDIDAVRVLFYAYIGCSIIVIGWGCRGGSLPLRALERSR